jgi:hypothetical protein
LAQRSGLDPYITSTSLFCPVHKGQIEKNGGRTRRKKEEKAETLCYQAGDAEDIRMIKQLLFLLFLNCHL